MEYYKEQLGKLEKSMVVLDNTPMLIFNKAEKCIEDCSAMLYVFRERVLQRGFKTQKEECAFFKTIKPALVSYMIHYMNRVHMERHRPYIEGNQHTNFFIDQITLLQKYFLEHREFYEYYIRGLTYRDTEFFCRKGVLNNLDCSSLNAFMDNSFATSHDLILATILGNLKTIEYLKNRKMQAAVGNGSASVLKSKDENLQWTGAKVDLIELVYALHATGMVNNGLAGINDLAEGVERLFHKKLGDYYRTFLEIRNRKIQPTKFLDHLKKCLENKIIEADG